MTDSRPQRLRAWLLARLAERGEVLTEAPRPLVADASFRRFARVRTDAGSHILMDAPPDRENNAGFLTVAHWLAAADLPAPRVVASDLEDGFLLVSDLGDTTLSRALDSADEVRAEALCDAAVDALLDLQSAAPDPDQVLPAYDHARLRLENGLFGEWFLGGLLDLPSAPAVLTDAIEQLERVHLAAPRVPVHLDWHSRNLMVLEGDRLGFVDFQDARSGPQGYDLVSLLRDCYRTHPPARIERLNRRFLDGARARGLPGVGDAAQFARVRDLVGLQRHLKAVGIFARLSLRDARHHALPDIPRTLAYVEQVAAAHAETRALGAWLTAEVLPRWTACAAARPAPGTPA